MTCKISIFLGGFGLPETGNVVPKRFPVWRTYFPDGVYLFQVGLIDSDSFSRWRLHTGSSFPWRFPVWQTWFLDGLWLLTWAIAPTWDRSGRPLPVCCHHRGKQLESTSHTLWATMLANCRKWLDQLHQTSISGLPASPSWSKDYLYTMGGAKNIYPLPVVLSNIR